MKDARTPTQLGEALAEGMFTKHRHVSTPQEFIVSSNFEGFCKGRGFTDQQRKECEDAYTRRHRELTNES